jgi:hypothetical protein
VLRRALEAQDAKESWTDEERRALSTHIEEGHQQAERGELVQRTQARREIETMKTEGRKGILRYYGSGIWKGDLKASRRNRPLPVTDK